MYQPTDSQCESTTLAGIGANVPSLLTGDRAADNTDVS